MSLPRIALDTNILVYAEALLRTPADQPKIAASRRLLRALAGAAEPPCMPAQALAETFQVLVRRGGYTPGGAVASVQRLGAVAQVVPTTEEALDAALGLAAVHGLQIFDAVIVAVAVQAGCELLVSEDLQDGFAWRGLAVTNPFGPMPDPRIAALTKGS